MKNAARLLLIVGALSLLSACSPQATIWVGPGDRLERDLSQCEYKARQAVPEPLPSSYPQTDYSQTSGFYDSLGQGVENSSMILADALAREGERNRLIDLCMKANGYEQVPTEEAEAVKAQMSTVAAQPAQVPDFYLFGDHNSEVFLGCLNCPSAAPESVLNTYGEFGNRYSQTSIFNRYGEYGSRYAQYSVCNPYAQEAPVIVDEAGGFYGRLTLNQNHSEANRNPDLLAWLEAEVCAD